MRKLVLDSLAVMRDLRTRIARVAGEPPRLPSAPKMRVENLEPRLMLDGVDPFAQRQALINGAYGFAKWGGGFAKSELLARQVPVLSKSLGDVVDVQKILEEKLAKPIEDYFSDLTPTVEELKNALKRKR
jgi:hypothetical protein